MGNVASNGKCVFQSNQQRNCVWWFLLFLYIIIKYCLENKCYSVSDQLKGYARKCRNLLENDNQRLMSDVKMHSNVRLSEIKEYIKKTTSFESLQLPSQEIMAVENSGYFHGYLGAFENVLSDDINMYKAYIAFRDAKEIDKVRVFKSFLLGNETIEIIKGVSFEIYKGDFVVLFGPSGCGKSTVLNMSLGLETPSKGTIKFLGKDLYLNSDEDERAQLRKKDIGMVYQQSNWVKSLNVIENVYFPLTLRGESVESREKKAWEILDLVDMRKGAYQKPTELSSGQQQRISLARALITDPALLVADEPTGNLDSTAGEEIMNLFRDLNLKGKTVIMVTHDLEYLKYATRSINMADGVVVGEYDQNDSRLKKLSVSKRGNVATNQSTGKS